MWFQYPNDTNTFPIELQFFYGDHLLVSPVHEENSTSVDIYLPKDTFYDFYTLAPVTGTGATVSLTNVTFTDIPLHIKGGAVIPMRVESAMTTDDLRKKDFQLVVAADSKNTASGSLYIDDGVSLEQKATTEVSFSYSKGVLKASGKFGYDVGSVKVSKVLFLGVGSKPKSVSVDGGKLESYEYDAQKKVVTAKVQISLKGQFSVKLQ